LLLLRLFLGIFVLTRTGLALRLRLLVLLLPLIFAAGTILRLRLLLVLVLVSSALLLVLFVLLRLLRRRRRLLFRMLLQPFDFLFGLFQVRLSRFVFKIEPQCRFVMRRGICQILQRSFSRLIQIGAILERAAEIEMAVLLQLWVWRKKRVAE